MRRTGYDPVAHGAPARQCCQVLQCHIRDMSCPHGRFGTAPKLAASRFDPTELESARCTQFGTMETPRKWWLKRRCRVRSSFNVRTPQDTAFHLTRLLPCPFWPRGTLPRLAARTYRPHGCDGSGVASLQLGLSLERQKSRLKHDNYEKNLTILQAWPVLSSNRGLAGLGLTLRSSA